MEAQQRPFARQVTERDGGSDGLDDMQLLAQVIHDLKNPLSVILCYSELVGESSETERVEYCQRIEANARTLLGLLDAFALLSDLRGGRTEPVRIACDWNRLVLGVASDLLPTASFRDQRFSCVTSGTGCVVGDRSHLTLAVRQLLLEALRVAMPGATLSVVAACEPQGVSVQVTVDSDPRAGSGPPLFDVRRPTLELVHRVVAAHAGSLSFDLQKTSVVATIYLPA
jgi:signal transduction histidine kinase